MLTPRGHHLCVDAPDVTCAAACAASVRVPWGPNAPEPLRQRLQEKGIPLAEQGALWGFLPGAIAAKEDDDGVDAADSEEERRHMPVVPGSGAGEFSSCAFIKDEDAEVVILAGQWRNKWVPCTIEKVEGGGLYSIHVLPTDKFDGAAGASDKHVPHIKQRHLRKRLALNPCHAEPALPPPTASVGDAMGQAWDALTDEQRELCVASG
eukprot:gene29037-49273_t